MLWTGPLSSKNRWFEDQIERFPYSFLDVAIGKLCSVFEIQSPVQYELVYRVTKYRPQKPDQIGQEGSTWLLLKPALRFGIMFSGCSPRCIIFDHDFLGRLMPTVGKREGTIRQPHNQVRMPTNFRELRCEHVSASEAGDGFQVLFEKTPDSQEGYVLVQRHFEFPDGGKCYLETDDQKFCGHFRFRSARLSRYRFQMVFGIGPVREITVFFKATDSAYAEVQRVLHIMIPKIRFT